MKAALFAILLLAGCKRSPGAPGPTKEEADREIAAIQAALDDNPAGAEAACATARGRLGARVFQLCEHDVHVAVMRHALATKQPCAPDDAFTKAVGTLEASGTYDGDAQKLVEAYAASCKR